MSKETYYKIICDAWQFFKAHYPPEDTSEYWKKILMDAEDFARQQNGSKFAVKLAALIVNEMERITKERGGRNEA